MTHFCDITIAHILSGSEVACPEADPAYGQEPQEVLVSQKEEPSDQGKSAILAATGIGKDQWNPLIATLLNRGLVRKEGERRGTKYHLV